MLRRGLAGEGDICPACGGDGSTSESRRRAGIWLDDCPDCNGTGLINIPNACNDCKGRGKITVDLGCNLSTLLNCDSCNGVGLLQ